MACQGPGWQCEDIVAVRGTRAAEPLLRTEGDLSDVVMKRAGHENAHQRRKQRDCRVARDDDDWVSANAWDGGIPDVAALNQRSWLARHVATENWESATMRASSC